MNRKETAILIVFYHRVSDQSLTPSFYVIMTFFCYIDSIHQEPNRSCTKLMKQHTMYHLIIIKGLTGSRVVTSLASMLILFNEAANDYLEETVSLRALS